MVGVGNDWDGASRGRLAPADLVSQFLTTNDDTFWVQRTAMPWGLPERR